MEKDHNAALAQQAVFAYLNRSDYYLDHLSSKGKIKIDPLLCIREQLKVNGKVYFDEPMRLDEIKYPLPKKTYHLTIPDSLSDKFRYTSKEQNYEHDYALIHQFSPLLPSKDSKIFFMEHHIWAISCGQDPLCVRALDRTYLKFKVENHSVTFIDAVIIYGITDFIGFGCFPREKLEEPE